jgi:hypothetical protein
MLSILAPYFLGVGVGIVACQRFKYGFTGKLGV